MKKNEAHLIASFDIDEKFKLSIYDDRPSFKFLEVNQIHSAKVVNDFEVTGAIEADGIVSQSFNLPLAIKTADCLPIVFIGEKGAAFVHAGWRGLVGRIALDDKIKSLDVKQIVVGPHIKKCCFEVTSGFEKTFINGDAYLENRNEHLFFDLSKYAHDQLIEAYPYAKITFCSPCTCCTQCYNSYRRNNTKLRNYNILFFK